MCSLFHCLNAALSTCCHISGPEAAEQRPAKRRKKSKQRDVDSQAEAAASAAEAAQRVVSGSPLARQSAAQAACLQLLSSIRKACLCCTPCSLTANLPGSTLQNRMRHTFHVSLTSCIHWRWHVRDCLQCETPGSQVVVLRRSDAIEAIFSRVTQEAASVMYMSVG